ncbi:MutS-related protein [Algoriphagus namhaensis]
MSKFDFERQNLVGKLKELKTKSTSTSLLRVLVFFGLIGLLVLFLADHPLWGLGFLILAWVFVRLIQTYNYLKDQESIYLQLMRLDEDLKNCQERKLDGFDSGREFLDKSHPFANDLDLFGDHSLFQLVNWTVSPAGRKSLGTLLKSPFDKEEAGELRKSVQELAMRKDFLFSMAAVGKAFFEEGKSKSWIQWLGKSEVIKSWIWPFAILGPLGGVVLSGLVYLGLLPSSLLGAWILLGMIFLAAVFSPLKKAGEEIPSRQELKTYRYWLELLDSEQFQSKKLQELSSSLRHERKKAHELLAELDSFGLWIQNRINILYIPINLLFWTDLLLYLRFQRWKNTFGKQVAQYPDLLAEWEVLYSLGIFQSELGGEGEVVAMEEGISGDQVNHPLLLPAKSVSNDYHQTYGDQVVLLTGANMSGKTTFMRTIGINCVLVNLGLRPFARRFGYGKFQLYTSMRNTDNLGESVSSFYAELSRIKSLIDRAESGEEIFFLLDEILKGTNTEDRIAGSEALIKQVVQTRALGIISTHDIELATLQDGMVGVKNYSFHSEVKDQTIDFDYKIKEGACPSFNAHKLMELMGIRFDA